jgi:FAD/FMN-containing dehydrogenase
VVDLSRMRGVTVDPGRRVARVLGGTLLRELDEAAQAHGLVCPVGVVGHTGVGGLTLGGGMGRLQRRLGFTVDNLRSVDLVTASGEPIHVGDDEHEDLFWGIRGAGPNFGVVTAFEFGLHELDPTVTNGLLAFPSDRAPAIVDRLRGFLPEAPDEVMVSVGIGPATAEPPFLPAIAGTPYVAVGTTYSGPPAGADEALRPLVEPLRALGPHEDTIEPRRYLELQEMADEDMAWGKRFYMKGGFLAELTDAFLDAAVEAVTDPPSAGCTITLWAMGGAIDRVAEDAMAFTGRAATYWLGVEAEWDDPGEDEAHKAWGRSTMDALQPFTAAGHYVNDMVESGEDVVRGIYGPAKYERLAALKRTYDPDNVFHLNQNVKP